MKKTSKTIMICCKFAFNFCGKQTNSILIDAKEWSVSRSWDGERITLKNKTTSLSYELPVDSIVYSEWKEDENGNLV